MMIIALSLCSGFDENDETNTTIATLRAVFGAVKRHFPHVRTMATLNWLHMPPETPFQTDTAEDWPLDIWVDWYAAYGNSASYEIPTKQELARRKWLSGGTMASPREFYWYWMIGPSGRIVPNNDGKADPPDGGWMMNSEHTTVDLCI